MDSGAEKVAAGQYGVITRRQAVDAGMSASAVDRRVRSGRWVATDHRGVFVVNHPPSWRQRLCAAVQAGRAGTVASHRSAAVLHRLRDGESVEITAPPGAGPLDHVVVHQASIVPSQRCMVEGIPTTRVERTLVDLAAVVDDRAVEHALEEALRLRLTTAERIRAALGRGRPGSDRLRRVLEQRAEGDGRATGSRLEVRVMQLLRAAGLATPVRQHEVRIGAERYFLDLAYPERRLAIEVDGFGEHGRRRAFESDRARQNALVLAGWTVLRFTWADVTERPDEVVATITMAMAA